MRAASLPVLILACFLTGCGAPTGPSNTGLVGTVTRGPIRPVCQADLPCDEPFGASFSVQQGSRVVASFRSDSQGHFESRLPPGIYLVVPGSDAPIMSPTAQAKQVEVGSKGLTTVLLQFDTGIR
jgi:hypothetical protein